MLHVVTKDPDVLAAIATSGIENLHLARADAYAAFLYAMDAGERPLTAYGPDQLDVLTRPLTGGGDLAVPGAVVLVAGHNPTATQFEQTRRAGLTHLVVLDADGVAGLRELIAAAEKAARR